MLKDLKAIIYFLAIDTRFSLIVFWSILLASLGVMYVTALLFDTQMFVSTSMAIYIFSAITGFLMTKEDFPYCIKMGATRNQFVIGSFVYTVGLALMMSLFHVVVYQFFSWLIVVGNIADFSMVHLVEVTSLSPAWYNLFLIDALVCFLFVSTGFLLSSIFYRLGLIGGITTIAVFIISLIIPTSREWILNVFLHFEQNQLVIHYLSMAILSILLIIPNWGLLRQASAAGATR